MHMPTPVVVRLVADGKTAWRSQLIEETLLRGGGGWGCRHWGPSGVVHYGVDIGSHGDVGVVVGVVVGVDIGGEGRGGSSEGLGGWRDWVIGWNG